MDSLKMLRILVQAVFDKALDEPNFVDMYADLCVRLNERSSSWSFVKVHARITARVKPLLVADGQWNIFLCQFREGRGRRWGSRRASVERPECDIERFFAM